MDDQATVNATGPTRGSRQAATAPEGNVAEVLCDLITLAELQADLAIVNSREAARRAAVPVGLIGFSLLVGAGGVTAGLIGLSFSWLHSWRFTRDGPCWRRPLSPASCRASRSA